MDAPWRVRTKDFIMQNIVSAITAHRRDRRSPGPADAGAPHRHGKAGCILVGSGKDEAGAAGNALFHERDLNDLLSRQGNIQGGEHSPMLVKMRFKRHGRLRRPCWARERKPVPDSMSFVIVLPMGCQQNLIIQNRVSLYEIHNPFAKIASERKQDTARHAALAPKKGSSRNSGNGKVVFARKACREDCDNLLASLVNCKDLPLRLNAAALVLRMQKP